jgi:lipopolysaccharide export system protein LptA
MMRLSMTAVLVLIPAFASAQQATVWYPNRNDPIQITANDVSVSDARHVAIFSGDVVVVQGETRLACSKAVARYHDMRSGNAGALDRIECEQ